MARIKPVAVAIAVPVLIAGWALFRPELLFVNSKVNEAAPSSSTAGTQTIANGSFESYAHETVGKAEILNVGDKKVLRLSGFKTSNGPDVHVLLVKGHDPKATGNGPIDLGSIKGNEGDQNYDLPANYDAATYGAVTIWCKRFDVSFGGADLKGATAFRSVSPSFSQNQGFATLAGFGGDIKVTSGPFVGTGSKVSGSAEFIERDGKRFLKLKNVKAKGAEPIHVLLLKLENVKDDASIKGAEKVDVGLLKPGKEILYPVSKELDIWLYRSVSLWADKSLGHALLRSDQERAKEKALA